ncbi:SRPBCC family protein [Actinoplanes sp. NPDC089786]|uniref:SRPBCC family protein n=1 Tax=Actinoplanes sp. NPDC089786 TaxID=3155185 RepID=UPI00341E4B2C
MRLHTSTVVGQPVDQVWAFLSDPVDSTPRWDRSIAEVIPRTTAPVGVGWEATTVSPSGKRQDFRVTAYHPGRSLTFTLLSSPMFRRADLTFQLTPTPSGTRIDHTIELTLRNPLLGPVLRLTSGRALATDLALLRDALTEAAGRSA